MLTTKIIINLILVSTFINISQSSINFLSLDQDRCLVNPNFTKAIEVLLHKTLKNHYKTIYFIAAISDEKKEYFKALKSELISMTHESYALRFDTINEMNLYVNKIRQNSIFIIDCIENFRLISSTIVPERYRFNGNFLFVLIFGYFEDLEEIYETLWSKSIHSVYTIYEEKSEILLNTFHPFTNSSSCGSTKPKVVAKFINGNFSTKISFPKKITNLNLCPIRIATYIDSTYINMNKFKNGSYELYGRGIDFMNVLSTALNYTNDIKIKTGDVAWGVVFENGTITGNFKELYSNNADISFSEYYMKAIRTKYFDPSLTLYTTPMVFIIPPGRPYNYIEKMLKPFHYLVWISLISTLGIAVVVILVVNRRTKILKAFVYGRKVQSPVTNIIRALSGQPQPKIPGRNFARFILMLFLILCLVLRTVYQGSLFQFLQSDKRHKEVQSIDEMIENDFTFYIYESALDVLQNHSKILARSKLFPGKNFFLDTQLRGDEKIAGLDAYLAVQMRNFNGSNIKVCMDHLVTFNVVLYFRKNFFLREEIDKRIDMLLSAGIVDHWMKSSLKYHGYHQNKDNHPRKLNLDDLRGPFLTLLSGYAIALCMYVLELVSHKREIIKIRVKQRLLKKS